MDSAGNSGRNNPRITKNKCQNILTRSIEKLFINQITIFFYSFSDVTVVDVDAPIFINLSTSISVSWSTQSPLRDTAL